MISLRGRAKPHGGARGLRVPSPSGPLVWITQHSRTTLPRTCCPGDPDCGWALRGSGSASTQLLEAAWLSGSARQAPAATSAFWQGPRSSRVRYVCDVLAHGTPRSQQTRQTPASQLQGRTEGGSCKTYDFYLDSVPLKNQSRTLPHWPARNLKGKL